jgi:hypothetical protein
MILPTPTPSIHEHHMRTVEQWTFIDTFEETEAHAKQCLFIPSCRGHKIRKTQFS